MSLLWRVPFRKDRGPRSSSKNKVNRTTESFFLCVPLFPTAVRAQINQFAEILTEKWFYISSTPCSECRVVNVHVFFPPSASLQKEQTPCSEFPSQLHDLDPMCEAHTTTHVAPPWFLSHLHNVRSFRATHAHNPQRTQNKHTHTHTHTHTQIVRGEEDRCHRSFHNP